MNSFIDIYLGRKNNLPYLIRILDQLYVVYPEDEEDGTIWFSVFYSDFHDYWDHRDFSSCSLVNYPCELVDYFETTEDKKKGYWWL